MLLFAAFYFGHDFLRWNSARVPRPGFASVHFGRAQAQGVLLHLEVLSIGAQVSVPESRQMSHGGGDSVALCSLGHPVATFSSLDVSPCELQIQPTSDACSAASGGTDSVGAAAAQRLPFAFAVCACRGDQCRVARDEPECEVQGQLRLPTRIASA